MDTIWPKDIALAKGPKYRPLAEAIRTAVGTGALDTGTRLPPVRELAWQLKITPGTVARAYSLLTDEGVLEAAVGRGTFVAEQPKRRAAPKVETASAYAPIEEEPLIHGREDEPGPVSFLSPALPAAGQSTLVRELLAEVAQAPPSGLMHYPSRDGSRRAREAVVTWLSDIPLGPLQADDVVLANGAQNAICLVLQAVIHGPSPKVLVEELSYPGFRRAAELLRAEAVPVAIDEHGVVPEAFAAAARENRAQVLCTSPAVHNPTGCHTPIERRRAIVDIARRYGVQILEDDCYRLGAAHAPCYRMLAPDLGWYVASISKTLTPSLRFGYAVAAEGQAPVLRRAAEHGFFGLATPLTDLVEKLLNDPRAKQTVEAVRQEVNAHVRQAVNILGGHDLVWREDVPFLWLRLPAGWRTSAFCQAAEARGVRVRPAEDYACRDQRAPHAVRIAINARLGPERYDRALNTLRELLDNPPEGIGV